MYLEDDIFKTIVAYTPLVSIDLLVRNCAGEVLLGRRRNRPAKGFWFVPGGRVRKDENLDAAFARLSEMELGQSIPRNKANLLGFYEHFYADNFSNAEFGTHYLVMAHELLVSDLDNLPNEQHNAYRWFSPAALLADDSVHDNTKAYFVNGE